MKNGLIDARLGQLYDKLFDNRQKGDYADMMRFDLDEVGIWYDEAVEFVKILTEQINMELGNK